MRFALLILAALAMPEEVRADENRYGSDIAFPQIDEYSYTPVLRLVPKELAHCVPRHGEGACIRLNLRLAEASTFSLDYDRTERLAREALALIQRYRPDSSTELSDARFFLATALGQKGQFEAAEALFRQVVEEAETRDKPDPIELARRYSALAATLDDQLRYEESFVLHRRAFDLARGVRSDNGTRLMELATNFGLANARIGNLAAAKEIFEIIAPASVSNPPISDRRQRANHYLAVIAFEEGNAEEVKRRSLYAFAMVDVSSPSAFDLGVYQFRALVADTDGMEEVAERYLADAYLAASRTFAVDSDDRNRTAALLAEYLLDKRGKVALARTMAREAAMGAIMRAEATTGFGPLAQRALREYRPIFTAQVEAAWRLSNP